jgi:hypothetical protein
MKEKPILTLVLQTVALTQLYQEMQINKRQNNPMPSILILLALLR